jgi:hypothetical protein
MWTSGFAVALRRKARDQDGCLLRHTPDLQPAANVHLLISNGRAPVVVAEVTPVLDSDVLYLRLQVDDVPRSGTRHTVDFRISGPPEEVANLVAELARVVEQASQGREG